VKDEATPIHGFGVLRRGPFVAQDVLRRTRGDVLGALGWGPAESSYRIRDSGPRWRLRDYGGHDAGPALLIVAGPIKRPYIWDLSPSASAVRLCLRQRFHVYLMEWLPASGRGDCEGIDDYTRAIIACVTTISDEASGAKPFIFGQSLGGTLATIFAMLAPESIRGLVLLAAPLCFEPGSSPFRDALVSLVPPGLSDADPFPGSLLSQASAVASPRTFVWSRLADAALSTFDHRALDLHNRVVRWTLDEVPLAGPLLSQIVEWLYRDNRLCRGALNVGEVIANPSRLTAPMLAVVNMVDDIAPLASVKAFTDAMSADDVTIIEHPGEIGVALQHLAILVGPQAHARVWPRIFAWLDAHR
jgi:polyhydroxyalkanoate synthase